MELNIILWLIGMLFSIGILAVKVGFGLAFGRLTRKQMCLILGGYLSLFVFVTILADRFLEFTQPILKSGAYIHITMAVGLVIWGVVLLHSSGKTKKGYNNTTFDIQYLKEATKPRVSKSKIPKSILLILPCPVCITAIGISVSSALAVLKLSSPFVGLAMGLFFILFAGGFAYFFKPKNIEDADVLLGLGMITIALYFIGSLFIPQKIEEAKLAYQAFSASSSTLQTTESTGILILFCVIFLLGFLFYKDIEDIL